MWIILSITVWRSIQHMQPLHALFKHLDYVETELYIYIYVYNYSLWCYH